LTNLWTGTNGTGDKSLTWLLISDAEDADDCNVTISNSSIGAFSGINLLDEPTNAIIETEGDVSLQLSHTIVRSQQLNASVPVIELDNDGRTQSAFTMTGGSQVEHQGTPSSNYCVSVDVGGSSGDMQFLFLKEGDGTINGRSIPWLRDCAGINLNGSSNSKGFFIHGDLRWDPAAATDSLFTQANTSGDGANQWVDFNLWLEADAQSIMNQGTGAGGIDHFRARILGTGDLTQLWENAAGLTSTLQTMDVDYQSGTTALTCATIFDTEADADFVTDATLVGQIRSHNTTLGLDYTSNGCSVISTQPGATFSAVSNEHTGAPQAIPSTETEIDLDWTVSHDPEGCFTAVDDEVCYTCSTEFEGFVSVDFSAETSASETSVEYDLMNGTTGSLSPIGETLFRDHGAPDGLGLGTISISTTISQNECFGLSVSDPDASPPNLTIQGAVMTIWQAGGGSSAGGWTDSGTVIHPTTSTDDVGNDATGTNWLITDAGAFTGASFTADPSATPSYQGKDSDMGGTPDVNIQIQGDCPTGTTAGGDEDCDLAFSTQVAGALTEAFRIDTTDAGVQTVQATAPWVGPAPVATSTGGALTINTITIATAAGDYDLPDNCDSATGDWATVYVRDAAETVSLTVTDATDQIHYPGLSLDANDELDSPGSALDQVTAVCMETGEWYVTGSTGSWTDGGTAD
jgi:hypothetical protein